MITDFSETPAQGMNNKDLPTLSGIGLYPATQEIHIFLEPLNPDQETLEKYYATVAKWNEQNDKGAPMKPCHLALVFRDAEGTENIVRVMQSARYYPCNDTSEVVQQCHKDAEFFQSYGLKVIREKIEATAYGIKGIPQDTSQLPDGKYFEFHIKVGRKDSDNC